MRQSTFYSNWDPAQPNDDSPEPGQDSAVLSTEDIPGAVFGAWFDKACTDLTPGFACKEP